MRRAVFLSHADDEIFLLPFLSRFTNDENVFIYLIDHAKPNRLLEGMISRNRERDIGIRYLQSIIKISEVLNIGEIIQSRDGYLYQSIAQAEDVLSKFLNKLVPIDQIVSLEFEMGHQDHDTSWVLARRQAIRLEIPHLSFPAYRAILYSKKSPLFQVMTFPKSVAVQSFQNNPIAAIWNTLRVMSIYRSQFTTWVGLAPFIIIRLIKRQLHYSINGSPQIEAKSLYHSRKKANSKTVMNEIKKWIPDNGW